MILRTQAFKILLVSAGAALLIAGCVEIPSEGHTPPDFKASVRTYYLDPAVSGSSTIRVAAGPNFDVWRSDVFPAGSFGDLTVYTTVDAGGKQLFLVGVDADTGATSIGSETRATLYVLPRTTETSRWLVVTESRTFEPLGIEGASRVKFISAVAAGVADTTDQDVDVHDSRGNVILVPFRSTQELDDVEADSTVSFWITRAGDTVGISDTVSITGASNSDYSLVGFDSADAASLEAIPNQE